MYNVLDVFSVMFQDTVPDASLPTHCNIRQVVCKYTYIQTKSNGSVVIIIEMSTDKLYQTAH